MTQADIPTGKEASAYLQINPHELYSLIRKGIIPAAK
jgi:hypothetical protein